MEFINLKEPIIVSATRTRQIMESIMGKGPIERTPIEMYFPSQFSLRAKVSIYDLLTPWEGSLQGLRVSQFRESGPRILQRTDGKVSWSKVVEGDDYERILMQFFAALENGMGPALTLIERRPGQEIIYSLETCASLLKLSFLEPLKPRLIPVIQWPSQRECVETVAELMPNLPFSKDDDLGSWTLKQEKENFIFEAYGERGALEFNQSSTDLAEIYWTVFKFLTRFEYFENSSHFTFDTVHLN